VDSDEATVLDAKVERVAQVLDGNEIVLHIKYEGETIEVTRKTKQSMVLAIDANSNQLTLFFKCQFVIQAVCDMLGYEFLDYSFPDSEDEGFDWNQVVPG
jgi:hypothetical protein